MTWRWAASRLMFFLAFFLPFLALSSCGAWLWPWLWWLWLCTCVTVGAASCRLPYVATAAGPMVAFCRDKKKGHNINTVRKAR